MAVLTLENVSYSYMGKGQRVDAVKSVNYSFESGNMYSIIGPSGSGKTTLLSLLAATLLPSSGTVSYNGVPLSEEHIDSYHRENAALIYQNYNLFPKLTVLENVIFPMAVQKKAYACSEKLAEETLLSIGLGKEHLQRFPAMLSGGEQQRVAIARALAAGSSVLLGDEPTGNLDPDNSKHIFEILQDLAHDSGKLIITVSHDPEIKKYSDVVLTMNAGILSE